MTHVPHITESTVLRVHVGRSMTESARLRLLLDAARPYFTLLDHRDASAIGVRTRPKRQRKPRLKTVLDKARKAGAAAVTRDGVTYHTLGQTTTETEPTTTADKELERWRRKHAR